MPVVDPARGALAHRAARGTASLAIVALAACGAGGVGDIVGDIVGVLGVGPLVSITVSGDTVVAVGDTVRLSTWGKRDGVLGMFVYDRVLDATWRVSDPTVASIVTVLPPPGDSTSTSAAIVTGRRQGSVQISAAARGVQAVTNVHVVASQ